MPRKHEPQCERPALAVAFLVAPMPSPLVMVFFLILSTFCTLSTASSIVIHGFGISENNAAPKDSTSYVPGIFCDRFYQIWLENIVSCP